jgi:hypothetical protein
MDSWQDSLDGGSALHHLHGSTQAQYKNSVAWVYILQSTIPTLVPTVVDRGCHAVSMTDPYDHILGFLDRGRYIFFQVASQLLIVGFYILLLVYSIESNKPPYAT